MTNLKGINCKNKHHVQYPDVSFCQNTISSWSKLLFLSQMSPWNLVLIPNLVTWLIQLSVVHTDQKRTTKQCLWRKLHSMTWQETWTFPRSLPSCWVLLFERNVFWHLEQHSIGIGNTQENLYIYSHLMEHLHWSTVTILLTWLNYLVWSMILWNGDFSSTCLTVVSQQFFWITEISSHQSLSALYQTRVTIKKMIKTWVT